ATHGDGAVHAAVEAIAETFADADNAALVRAMAAAAAEDAHAAAALYSTLTRPTQHELAAAIRAQGSSRGQLGADLLAEMVLGTLLYRVLTRTPVTVDLVEALAGLSGRP
ncbi:MAG: TetR/AcrR family transcriptional regulator C-terminal ligand-binding domain-containing protein, partial [Actinomycetes bacterium]